MNVINALLEDLNEPQRAAVTALLGNALILAGAGSGKTRVLVHRIAWLITEKNILPSAILAVTFTNKAASEMQDRLRSLLPNQPFGMWIGTFHSLCHRILRLHHKEAKLSAHFQIIDSDDQLRLLKRVIISLNLDPERWSPKAAQLFINSKKDEGLRPEHIPLLSYGPISTWVNIYKEYETFCQSAEVIDFCEIIFRAYELLRDNLDLLAYYHRRFQAILIDEFQDTNTLQYAWIRLLASPHTSVMAVGDDDQSIYGWRGAKIENIQQFSSDFNNTQIICLEQNYRSTSNILTVANALIDCNNARIGKKLWTKGCAGEKIEVYSAVNEIDEARFVSERIAMLQQKGRSGDEIAILYRSNAQSRILEERLLQAGIAYRIHGGVRFFERAEVKDALAYLRLLANIHDDTAFERIINFPARGIGEKTLQTIRDSAKIERCSLWEAMSLLIAEQQFPTKTSSALKAFIHLIETMREKTKFFNLNQQIKEIIYTSGLYDYFSKVKGEKSEARLENLQELVNAAKQFQDDQHENDPLPPLVSFLAHTALDTGAAEITEEKRCVHLMTLHAAKGLEFPMVFLVGMEEGVFPSKQSLAEPNRLEEERRLCYVGITRAREKLIFSHAAVKRQYGHEEYYKPSRFIRELPQEVIEKIGFNTLEQSPISKKIAHHDTPNSIGFKLGQQVNHPNFGPGILLNIEGSGAHTRVQVKFKSVGIKWLVLTYANLTGAN